MSSLRFPMIQTKKTLVQEQDYNFVNKDKKKKTNSSNPLELIDQLKRKIDEQKKQIDNRNITIQGLQRNFQSLSVIVKNQKAQSAILRSELQSLRMNSETGDKRAAQFHQKCIMLEKENKSLKEDLKIAKKAHSECSQYVTMNEQFKKRITYLEQVNQKLHNKIMQGDTDKKILQIEFNKLRLVEKDKRILNQRIIDLEDELKRLTDTNNTLGFKITLSEQEINKYKNQVSSIERFIEQLKLRIKDSQKQKERLIFENEYLTKQNSKLNATIQQKELMMSNKQMFNKLKHEEEQKMKKEYSNLMRDYNQLEQNYKVLAKQSEEKSQVIKFAQNQIDLMRFQHAQLVESFKDKENTYRLEIQKLTNSINDLHNQLNLATGEFSSLNRKLNQQKQRNSNYNEKVGSLHQNIDQMNRKMMEHQQRYGNYLKLIAMNEPDVIITNEREMNKLENSSVGTISKLNSRLSMQQSKIVELENVIDSQVINIETMRKYIKNLEEQISTKSEQLLEKTRSLRRYQEQEDQLNKMIANQRRQSELLKREAERTIMERMRELENQKLRSQKEIQDEKIRLQHELNQQKQRIAEKLRRQQEKSEKYNKLLQQYRKQQQKLKEMMAKEQQQLLKQQQEREEQINRIVKEKQQQLQKEKKNNKMLWSDNKKLKDLENQLRQDSTKQLQEKEAMKKQEIQRLKRQLEKKYKEEMSHVQQQESNTTQLKKILNQRTNQHKSMTQNFNKLKIQSEFYKNRNKELESLVARLEKQFKDKTVDLERQNKSNKQVIQVLDKKLKQSQNNYSQLQRKQKKQLKYLYDQIQQMKNQAKNHRVQQKISLVNKSMGDLDTSLKTLMNTMSCNYCVEVVRQCVRLQCGHIYCKKCKGGYEPNCGQCKQKSTPSNDKMIDDSVSKAQYMRILINTIKDDLSKISK